MKDSIINDIRIIDLIKNGEHELGVILADTKGYDIIEIARLLYWNYHEGGFTLGNTHWDFCYISIDGIAVPVYDSETDLGLSLIIHLFLKDLKTNDMDGHWDARIEEERELFLTDLLDLNYNDTQELIKPDELVVVELWDGVDFRKVGYGYFRWNQQERRFIFEADEKNSFNKEYQFDGIDLKNLDGYIFKKIIT